MKSPLALSLLALLTAGAAHAQQVYRVVGPDGRVTFSDKPPAASTQPAARVTPGVPARSSGLLPYELNRTAQRFPVTLYSSDNCPPCDQGRNLLINRGIPFTEKTVNANADISALQKMTGGDGSLPLLTIGGQQLKGFGDAEWSKYLDAAGYPQKSQLPSGWRRPAATPLVPVQIAPAAPAGNRAAAPAADPLPATPSASPSVTPPPPSANNPAGIRF
ncbi:glutaredoxin family protein [Comamonadaceae bacterium OH2545_COT-014]|nr:glutaredoxin family protein [Comamonadaceae bacterium OH2545_COT-014]